MRLFIIVAYAVLLTACASITTGQNQSLSVETPGCLAATCKLRNGKGTWFVTSTPGSVTVQRAYGDMTVTCEKGDYKSTTMQVPSTTKPMAFGNILFGGLIGAAVDVGTGAAYDYPPSLIVSMTCTDVPVPPHAADTVLPVPQIEAVSTSPPTRPVPQAQPGADGAGISGHVGSKYMYNAEHFAKDNGCKTPIATMTSASEGTEVFSIVCAGSTSLAVRCETGQCRAVQ